MTTEKATDGLAPIAPIVSATQLDLVRRTVAVGATDDELRQYLYDCERRGVHPLDRLIHFTVRTNQTTGERRYTPITGIDFMRQQAHTTGACAGISDAVFSGDMDTAVCAASVTVRRLVQGVACDFTATARWSEYYPGDGKAGMMWRKMPHVMLGKCAEALALRKAFPAQLAGLYAREEMDQATGEVIESTSQPIPAQLSPPPSTTAPPPDQPIVGVSGRGHDSSSVRLISDPQRKRMYAIGKKAGWTDDEMKRLLSRHGFAQSVAVTREKYEAICNELEAGSDSEAPEYDDDEQPIF